MAANIPAASRLAADNRIVYIIAFLAVLLRVCVAFTSQFTNEDAFITLRYAANIAHGYGFCYNVGQHVLGTTTPLYTLMLALFQWLHLPALSVGKLINILADGALCVAAAHWARVLAALRPATIGSAESAGFTASMTRTFSILFALFVALNPIHIRWAVSGMETSLVTLCGVFVWLRFTQGRYAQAFAAMGLLFLLRWDSVLMLAALTIGTIVRTRRIPLREFLIYIAIILPWLVFAAIYFGAPIPVTAASKMAVYGWRASHDASWTGRNLPQFGSLLRLYVGNPISALFSVSALAGIYIAGRSKLAVLVWPLSWFILYWCAFLYSRVLLFPWYAAPPLPVYELFAAFGLSWVINLALRYVPAARINLVAVITTGALFLIIGYFTSNSCGYTQTTESAQSRDIGLWLHANAPPGNSVMLEPIGYIGYYSNLNIVDVVGLVTPWTTHAYTPQTRSPMRDIALAHKPDWCVLRPVEVQHIMDADRIDPGARHWGDIYKSVRVFSMPRVGRDPILFTVFKRR